MGPAGHGQQYCEQRGVSANSLDNPEQSVLDGAGDLRVADSENNRVLMYPPGSTTATKVFGQTSFTTNGYGTSSTTFDLPVGVAVDTNGTLFVSDRFNERVLAFFHATSTVT